MHQLANYMELSCFITMSLISVEAHVVHQALQLCGTQISIPMSWTVAEITNHIF